jgi:hypothetical protein
MADDVLGQTISHYAANIELRSQFAHRISNIITLLYRTLEAERAAYQRELEIHRQKVAADAARREEEAKRNETKQKSSQKIDKLLEMARTARGEGKVVSRTTSSSSSASSSSKPEVTSKKAAAESDNTEIAQPVFVSAAKARLEAALKTRKAWSDMFSQVSETLSAPSGLKLTVPYHQPEELASWTCTSRIYAKIVVRCKTVSQLLKSRRADANLEELRWVFAQMDRLCSLYEQVSSREVEHEEGGSQPNEEERDREAKSVNRRQLDRSTYVGSRELARLSVDLLRTECEIALSKALVAHFPPERVVKGGNLPHVWRCMYSLLVQNGRSYGSFTTWMGTSSSPSLEKLQLDDDEEASVEP